MVVDKEQIGSFIPQRPPFLMVDNLLEVTPEYFETDFRIMPDNLFLEGSILREFALIENIAQSSAAGIAYLNQYSQSRPKDGLMGGIAKLKVYDLPRIHDLLFTRITKLNQLGNMYLFKGENYVNGKKLLECEIKLVGLQP